MRTQDGMSPLVHSGNALFTLIGFLGLYLLLGLLFLFLVGETIWRGPAPAAPPPAPGAPRPVSREAG
jgi:cytochrome d ubiquinol oxidase subunit I